MEVSALISVIDERFRNKEKLTKLDSCYHLRERQINFWIKFKILQSKITHQVFNYWLRELQDTIVLLITTMHKVVSLTQPEVPTTQNSLGEIFV